MSTDIILVWLKTLPILAALAVSFHHMLSICSRESIHVLTQSTSLVAIVTQDLLLLEKAWLQHTAFFLDA